MRSVTALTTAFLMIVSSMAGCIEGLEEIAEIIGCSDENAENFDPDATSGSDDLCLFLENEARFVAALGDAMAADPTDYLLDSDSGVSGVQYGIELDGVDPDSGMSVSLEMLSVIMVDLESQSMYNRSMTSYMDMLSIDTEMVWSGTDVMVTTSIGGPFAGEDSGTFSSIGRDMSPDLEEAVRAASVGMRGMMGMEDLAVSGGMPSFDDDRDHDEDHDEDYDDDRDQDEDYDDEESDFDSIDRDQDGFVELEEIEALLNDESSMTSEVADCIIDAASPVFFDADDNDDEKLDEYEFEVFDSDMSNVDIEELCFDRESSMDGQVPEGSSISITYDEETGIQTMVMQTMDEAGDMSTTIRLHGDGSFHSYEMGMDDGETVVSVSFGYLTSEMVSMPEIDHTLDRTATPISFEVESMMVCDNGDLVDVLSVMDGWWDCNDGSDESFVDDRDEHYYEAHWDFCEWDEYLGGDGYMEEGYLCWVEDLDDLSMTQIEELQDCEQSENGCETEVYCEEVSYGYWECAYYDIDTNEDEEDDFDWVHHWESYFDGHCEWEGNPDDGEDRWSCMRDASQSDWDNWWWYCELHDEDWFCTDDYGQDPDHEHSADNVNYNESNASEEDPSSVDGMNWDGLYPRGYCEWEGNLDYGEDRWSCKGAEWDNWWYYCENHDEDWFCTDDYGQDPDHEHSAHEDNYYSGYHDEEPDWEDFEPYCYDLDTGDEVDSWDSDDSQHIMEQECYEMGHEWVYSQEREDELHPVEEICIWEDDDGVTHYDCEGESEEFDFPTIVHAHVVHQVFNAPIADFELRMLDCPDDDTGEEDDMEDDSEPVWDECTVVIAFPLSGGDIDGIVVDYVDSDEDGMVSSGDISIISGPVGGYEIQPYDMWAEDYSANSALIGQEVPGFGAFLAAIGLLGAAFIGRKRDA